MTATHINPERVVRLPDSTLGRLGAFTARYGLVIVIAWIAALKFTAYEARGIEPLVSNSPIMSWVYTVFSVPTFSAVLGVIEVATAGLLAIKPSFPRLSALRSLAAIGLFLGTLSFLVTTPGIGEESAGGFPALSSTGQFLVKDIALLGNRGLDIGRRAGRGASRLSVQTWTAPGGPSVKDLCPRGDLAICDTG